MQTLLSQPVVADLHARIKQRASELIDRGVEPHLAVVLVGEDPSSVKYVGIKSRVAKELGIIVSLYHLEESSSFEEIEKTLTYLSNDPEVHGVIVQLPLPEHITPAQVDKLLKVITPEKDVDGLRGDWKKLHYSGYTLKALLEPQRLALPPMVGSVLSLLDYYNIDLAHKHVVVVGKGRLVGQPLEEYLSKVGVEVQAVTEETPNILTITQSADILIVGVGEPDLVTYQWIKEGAVVVDCNADVHLDSVSQVASAIAPPVGGVGPLTVSWLLYNTVQAASYGGSHE